MKVAFFASDKIAIPSLELLLNCEDAQLALVVSNPDKPKGRGKKLSPNDVSAWAIEKNIPLLRPEKSPSSETIEVMKNLGIDVIFVMAYGKILRDEILHYAPLGIYNLHGSILPKFRGASPLESAIATGEKSTGITLMKISKQMDCGDIGDTCEFEISPCDNAISLREKAGLEASKLLAKNLQNIANKSLKWTAQNSATATYCRKIFKCDFRLDFSRPASELDSRIRAFGGALLVRKNGDVLKVGEAFAEDANSQNSTCAKLISADSNGIKIACRLGILNIAKLQAPCAKMLGAREFLNGYSFEKNEIFESFELPPLISNSQFSKQDYENLIAIK